MNLSSLGECYKLHNTLFLIYVFTNKLFISDDWEADGIVGTGQFIPG